MPQGVGTARVRAGRRRTGPAVSASPVLLLRSPGTVHQRTGPSPGCWAALAQRKHRQTGGAHVGCTVLCRCRLRPPIVI